MVEGPLSSDAAPVGREAEIAALTGLLDEVTRSRATRFGVVQGEPGIGKSHLLSVLARRAAADGWLVLHGRSTELEQDLPFGLVVDALDGLVGSLPEAVWEATPADELAELASIFPSLHGLRAEPAYPRTPVERFKAHRAVAGLYERLAADQRVLLILDDLHWADGASLELAVSFLRRPPAAAVAMVGSFRTGQADPQLVQALGSAARDGTLLDLTLAPLSRIDADLLLGGEAVDVYEQSGGNPFYLLQLARARSGVGSVAGPADSVVPAAVAAAIAGELDGVPDAARTFLDAAAVAGDPFELDLAASVARVDEVVALEAIDVLVQRDLIRAGRVPRAFLFRHPLVRAAVYGAMSPGSRIAAHQRAAEVLRERGASAVERAQHVEHAARHGDTDAVAILATAASAAVARSPRTASRWLETALAALPGSAPAAQRRELLTARAGALAATGRLADSRTALIEALELAADAPVAVRAELIAACANTEQLLGMPDQSERRLRRAVAELDGGEAAAGLMVDLALHAFYAGDHAGMADWSGRAIAAAQAAGETPAEVAATAVRAFALTIAGAVADAQALCDTAARMVDEQSDDEIAETLNGVTWVASAEFYLERYRDSVRHGRLGLEIARRHGIGGLVPALAQALANGLFNSGHVLEAGALLDEMTEAARLTDSPVGIAWALLNRAFAATLEGDVDTADTASREAWELASGFAGSPVAAWSGAIRGRVLLDQGDPRRALDVMVGSGGEDGDQIVGAWRAVWLEWAALCCLGIDDDAGALRYAALARVRADAFGLNSAPAAACRAEARNRLRAGDAAGAAVLATEAAERAVALENPLDEANARVLTGTALAAAEESDAAVAELERAVALFEACGAYRHRTVPERELRRLGRSTHRRSRPGTGDGVEALTGRELEVATLIVDRRTNTEIAAELFLSVKTVETHIRHIFRKLDVASRAEIARVVEAARQ